MAHQRPWLLSDQSASVTVRLPGSYRFTSRQDEPAAQSGPSSDTSTTNWKDLLGTHIGTSARRSVRTFVLARAGKLCFYVLLSLHLFLQVLLPCREL